MHGEDHPSGRGAGAARTSAARGAPRPPPRSTSASSGRRHAGAAVFRGIERFGARSVVHTSGILDLSTDLPVVVEVLDTEEQMQRLGPILDEMASRSGIVVTLEPVHVLGYGPRAAP